MTFNASGDGQFAGLLAFMDEAHFVAFGIENGTITLRRRASSSEPERGVELAQTGRRGPGPVELRIRFNGGRADFAWRPAGKSAWRDLAKGVDVEPLASVHAGLFTGLVVGPYAVAVP